MLLVRFTVIKGSVEVVFLYSSDVRTHTKVLLR